jgi:hypothetical protein
MEFALRRIVLSYPTNIVAAAITWGVAFALVEGLLSPHIKDGTSAEALFLIIDLLNGALLFVGLIGAVILLFRRKWRSALCYLSVACVLYASMMASSALQGGDRFFYTSGPHREIAEIYQMRRSELAPDKQQFFSLEQACRPPGGCDCWLLWDPNHSSHVETDIGGWHRPYTPFFPQDSGFAIVDVRRIDSNAYSVLGCSVDWTSIWLP